MIFNVQGIPIYLGWPPVLCYNLVFFQFFKLKLKTLNLIFSASGGRNWKISVSKWKKISWILQWFVFTNQTRLYFYFSDLFAIKQNHLFNFALHLFQNRHMIFIEREWPIFFKIQSNLPNMGSDFLEFFMNFWELYF